MADITITITYNSMGVQEHGLIITDSQHHTSSGDAAHQDDITTNVSEGKSIQWVIGDQIGFDHKVTKIIGISPNTDQPEFLENKVANSDGSYSANIKVGVSGVEKYNIHYYIDHVSIELVDDPKMRVDT